MQAVSPDGRLLATGGRKGSLHLWQLQGHPDDADPGTSCSEATVLVDDAEVSFLLRDAKEIAAVRSLTEHRIAPQCSMCKNGCQIPA